MANCIERLPSTFEECGLVDCVQESVTSEKNENVKAHLSKAMLVGLESIFNTIVRYSGNDMRKIRAMSRRL
jgi:hypothetical protein